MTMHLPTRAHAALSDFSIGAVHLALLTAEFEEEL